MKLPDHISPVAVEAALLNIGMTINEIRELTRDRTADGFRWEYAVEDLNGDILDLNDDAYSDVETLWTWNREVAEETHAAEYGSTLVRRLAGPIEPIDKEN